MPPGEDDARSPRRPRRGGDGRHRGQSIVEFTLLLPVFLLLLLIAADFGRVFFTAVQLNNAVREAANYGATRPTDTAGMLARANAERNTQAQAGQQNVLTAGDLQTTCADSLGQPLPCDQAPGGVGSGNTLTVTITAPFSFLAPLVNGFFGNNFDISSSATVAVLGTPADPNATPPPGCSPPSVATFAVFVNDLTVTLDPSGSLPESGICAISGYNYDLGDGETAVGGTVPTDYTYSTPGTYTITLEVTNQGGALSTTRTVTVPPSASPSASASASPSASASASASPSASVCTPPIAAFTYTSIGPRDYRFTDTSTTPAGCPIQSWLWNFGDGDPQSNAQNPTHKYKNNVGTVTVTLTVTNAAGSNSTTRTLTP
jgi:PKD repeat protein